MRVAIVGFGLIGGSVARALRRAGGRSLAAWSPRSGGPGRALAEGILDAAPPTLAGTIAGADLVVLAAPPPACLTLVGLLAGDLRAALGRALVTDVASTKAAIVERAGRLDLRFVGGHPMAGREASGYAAGSADLFDDRPWVVVPAERSAAEDVERVRDLARACGARPVEMGAADHDAAVAAISHLPLIVAAALVEAVVGAPGGPQRADWPAAAALATSGWQGMTRLARGEPAMGGGIAATNAGPIALRLRDLRAALDSWLAELEALDSTGGDPAAASRLTARFAADRERLAGR